MTVSYFTKGQGTLTANCDFDEHLIQQGDIVLPVLLKNTDEVTVLTADITFYICKKPIR